MTQYLENLEELPFHMRGAMQRYIENGIPPGSFLEAVLCNDLMGALGKADSENINTLRNYGVYLYSFAPSNCFGSRQIYRDWVESGGLEGQRTARGLVSD